MERCAGEAASLTSAPLFVGEEERSIGGRKEERDKTDSRVHLVGNNGLGDEDYECWCKSSKGDRAERVRCGSGEDCEVEHVGDLNWYKPE